MYSFGSEQNRKMLFILAKCLLNLTKLKTGGVLKPGSDRQITTGSGAATRVEE
jgi:hypothetical protein